MSLFNWIEFSVKGDERGRLIALEAFNNVPFAIKRVYYLSGLDSATPRGFHAHKALRQLAICVAGNCEIIFDDGQIRRSECMSSSDKGLLIEPMIWHEMHNFSRDCIFMVLASDLYDESDYIRDYSEFQLLVNR